jgi:hypothetical protein
MEAASATLEKYPDVPDWLKLTVREAVRFADDLAPPSESAAITETHLYPH